MGLLLLSLGSQGNVMCRLLGFLLMLALSEEGEEEMEEEGERERDHVERILGKKVRGSRQDLRRRGLKPWLPWKWILRVVFEMRW